MGFDTAPTLSTRWSGLPPFLRFLVVGVVNTLFGYGAYAFFLWIGFHFSAAALLGTVAGVIFNFFTTGRLVFDRARRFRSALPFVAVYSVVYAINVALLALLEHLGVGPYLAGLILIVPLALISFLLMRRFVFGPSHAAH